MNQKIRIALILFVAAFSTVALGQPQTYQLVDGAAGDQAGHTLSGFITLDPACGTTCSAFDDWEYTISGPTLNRSASFSQYGQPLFSNNGGLFIATENELIVDFAPTDRQELVMDFAGLAWNLFFPPGSAGAEPHYAGYDFEGLAPGGWDSIPSPRSVVIARVVPEPSSSLLILASFLPCLLLRSKRNRTHAAS